MAGLELGDIQRALVQQVGVDPAIVFVELARRDELVNVLVALVIPHVDHRATILGQGDPCAFMLESSQRGSLGGYTAIVVRIDLDHPAKPVGFVRMHIGAEALVMLMPAIAETALGDAIAILMTGRRAIFQREVTIPVFLAGQISPPGGVAMGTVVQGSQNFPSRGVGLGLHQRMSRRRPGHPHRAVAGQAPPITGGAHHFPTGTIELDLDHGHAVRRLTLANLLGGPGLHATDMQQAVVGVFMVHHQNAPGGIGLPAGQRKGQREEVHAIVMHAGLQFLIAGGVAGIRFVFRAVRDGIAPGIQDLDGIIGGDAHHVLG